MSKQRITLERSYQAELQDVWDLWTTKEGIESWWGPEGFRVEVKKLELRPQGELVYEMIAEGPDQVAFMKQAGMPLRTLTKIRYTEIVPMVRLAYLNEVDFVPGHAAYDVATVVELKRRGEMVDMTLTLDPMHDEIWTQRAAMGWQSELGKLEKVLAARVARVE